MEQANFHKQKLYSLILAGVAVVSLALPWIKIDFMGFGDSANGFRGWGFLSLIGAVGVVALSLMGNKQEDYTAEYKKYVLISFGAIAVGAILFLIRKNTVSGGVLNSSVVKTGIGLWLCLVVGVVGAALAYGLIKLENKKPV